MEKPQPSTTSSSVSVENLSPFASKLVYHIITNAHDAECCPIGEGPPPNDGGRLGVDTEGRASYNISESGSTADSTQVLVPVNPFPEESATRLGLTTSGIQMHTFEVESETGGSRIHRNPANQHLDHPSLIIGQGNHEEVGVGGGGGIGSASENAGNIPPSSTPVNPVDTLMDEMSKAVAENSSIFDFAQLKICK